MAVSSSVKLDEVILLTGKNWVLLGNIIFPFVNAAPSKN